MSRFRQRRAGRRLRSRAAAARKRRAEKRPSARCALLNGGVPIGDIAAPEGERRMRALDRRHRKGESVMAVPGLNPGIPAIHAVGPREQAPAFCAFYGTSIFIRCCARYSQDPGRFLQHDRVDGRDKPGHDGSGRAREFAPAPGMAPQAIEKPQFAEGNGAPWPRWRETSPPPEPKASLSRLR